MIAIALFLAALVTHQNNHIYSDFVPILRAFTAEAMASKQS